MLDKLKRMFGGAGEEPQRATGPGRPPETVPRGTPAARPAEPAATAQPEPEPAPAAPAPEPAPAAPRIEDDPGSPLHPAVVDALKTVYDPEIPVDIYELGLVYQVAIDRTGRVDIEMTLTSPSCPAAEQIPQEVDRKTRALDGVTDVQVRIVWDPPWDKDRMSEAARLELGMD